MSKKIRSNEVPVGDICGIEDEEHPEEKESPQERGGGKFNKRYVKRSPCPVRK